MVLNFSIIGVGGYIATRHLSAIKNNNHNLVISYDKVDTVGYLDKYFPNSLFFNDFQKFKNSFNGLKKKIDYTVILTPNYTHFKYIKFALSNGSNVICEKPLVLSKNHINQIIKLEKKYNRKVYTILQLRTLKEIRKLKNKISKSKKKYEIQINYITPRGHWYKSTWKADKKKSGGVIFNIGIHLLDLLCYLFGDYKKYRLFENKDTTARGEVFFEKAKAKFLLSIDKKFLKKYDKKVVRDFIINGKKIDLVKNFETAHLDTYNSIIKKKSFSVYDVKKSINLAIDLQK